MIYLLIALGGALGSMARYWLSTLIDTQVETGFPWGTLFVNIAGCIIIGVLANLDAADRVLGTTQTRFFLMTGLCGGFTTFSSFSLQTLSLMKDGEWHRALSYVIGSVVLCLLGVWLGHSAAELFNTKP